MTLNCVIAQNIGPTCIETRPKSKQRQVNRMDRKGQKHEKCGTGHEETIAAFSVFRSNNFCMCPNVLKFIQLSIIIVESKV